MTDLLPRAAAWRDADPDPQTRAEIDQLLASGDTAGLAERFEGELAFGTAGIRAEIGAGPMRMNRMVVGRVAAGLARYIASSDPSAASVVIGYDGRTNSAVFAQDLGRILSRAGVAVSMLPGPLPTPVLAFSVRDRHAAYGLMVTASHNPRQYNGIKVYERDGGQLLPPRDEQIAAAIDATDPLHLPHGWSEGSFDFTPADDSVADYVTAVAADRGPDPDAVRLKVVHTALHGVGDGTLRAVFAKAGWPDPIPVVAQQQPDPHFPTAHYPNPEEPGVLDLAARTAAEVGADLVLANDPDADRLAVMVPDGGAWRALTGDELGILFGDAVLTRDIPPSGVVATTVVSGSLLRHMSNVTGVRCVTTLTGFKWIARAGGDDHTLVYGYEQALGYAVRPDLVADKDGISAALLALRIATVLAGAGQSLTDRLDDIYLANGLHVTGLRTLQGDLSRLNDAVESLRKAPPRQLAGRPLTVTDLEGGPPGVGPGVGPGVVDLAGGHAERSPDQPLPSSDVLIWRLGTEHPGDGARVMIRPSGTEPEIKVYAEVASRVSDRSSLAAAKESAAALVDELLAATAATLEPGDKS